MSMVSIPGRYQNTQVTPLNRIEKKCIVTHYDVSTTQIQERVKNLMEK